MAKILEMNPHIITIGMDNGSILEVSADSLNFVPHVNDEVEVFQTANKTIVSKKTADMSGGININIDNSPNISSTNQNTNQNTNDNYNRVQQTVAPPAYFVGIGRPVNKMVYLLVCFFLGSFGIQKFLAGKTGAGILSILFCWTYIPTLVAFFDFFSALFKSSDANGNIYF